jgi:hypothetical protein
MTYMDIRPFLRKHNMEATAFGRRAVNDPKLVADIMAGRVIRPKTEARIKAFMESYQPTPANA